ncbi:anti-sigma factor RsbA family regulatory protein [Actinopolymorpha singaporensis]|uniref:Histidine kinase-like ATPase domain-containing protein n=1 Tax=Actinopolymorpha singaporensis TaxID=117157 RepID=A0A1H1UMP0_9ACTN|nr:anti-sigma factor RsbA family regulatory protein [Actinopolymorpha singaporensis]SDS73600.1 Histidine kinase-like ATPase domain-containing protein [Actinopolymorpha singaporensis]
MSVGEVDGFNGHFHEAGFYASDAEFRALIVPFVAEGIAAGEPVVIGYDKRKADLLRSWLDDPSTVTFIADRSLYATPARAIATYRGMFERHVAAGAPRIRIAGDVPHPGNGGRFEGWDRYEFAVNSVWEEFPVRSLCLYDARTVSEQVRNVVERAHPHVVTAAGVHGVNSRYEGHGTRSDLPVTADPLEASTPAVELTNPSAAEARQTLEKIARRRVDDHTLEDLLLGISEAVANARLHGVPPTTVRIWATDSRVVVRVQDRGKGPVDPLAGLVPSANTTFGTGLGLWMTHLLDIDATLIPTADGFSLRLRAVRDPAPVD